MYKKKKKTSPFQAS